MLLIILVYLYKIHLHPILKKYFPFLDNPSISMILQPVKNRFKVMSKKSEVINELVL